MRSLRVRSTRSGAFVKEVLRDVDNLVALRDCDADAMLDHEPGDLVPFDQDHLLTFDSLNEIHPPPPPAAPPLPLLFAPPWARLPLMVLFAIVALPAST
jgi:hypothetical protein